eukprot:Colp12_sorted_trinity150504_noHs@35766
METSILKDGKKTVCLEICVESVESAQAAKVGGANRIELCCNLSEGGTTPSHGLLKMVKTYVDLPTMVMIRPRGGDFLYSDVEFEIMKEDLLAAKQLGADGFVFGILTADGKVDVARCAELIGLARPLPVTFHRAFDVSADLSGALEALVQLGVQRVLTSGGEPTVLEGLPTIAALIAQSKGRITIMAGGGVNTRNLQRILDECPGLAEVHTTALHPPEYDRSVTDPAAVATLARITCPATAAQ